MDIRSLCFSLPLTCFLAPSAFAMLTKTQAELRSQQVSNIEYKIDIDLTKSIYNAQEDEKETPKLPLYSGKATVMFSAASNVAELSKEFFLDFSEHDGGELQSIKVNGTKVDSKWDKKDGKIYLSTATLIPGQLNQVDIEFINRFTRKGKGFHRALDIEDKEVYIFTNLEAYYANEVFPLFDQPDLKATYQLTTEVPSHWEVVSNTREQTKEDLTSDTTKWTFEKSQLFSTYVFTLVAGPYKVWTPQEQTHIPMRLLARRTAQNDIDPDVWFKITQNAFKYYESHFGPYQFKKYDQILVPEITSGAMENVGAVTFNEYLLTTGGHYSISQKTKLRDVITHEMAHMWFGDLVTMKWWDDLWLNESFATFSSVLAGESLKGSLDLLDSWEYFFSRDKTWGYNEDSYSTTHPIVAKNVDDTDAAQSIFDGISYGKGSAVLKQLYYYIGDENFYKGVRNYLDTFRFQNATRIDFMNALSSASGLDLLTWDKEWLQTQGTNSVKVSLLSMIEDQTEIILTPYKDPIDHQFRTHRTQVGIYDYNSEGRVVLTKTIPVTYSDKPVFVETLSGQLPVFVFANESDYDFVQEIFDDRTLNQIREHLSKLDDGLLKQQIYFSLIGMVKNSQLSGKDFAEIVLNALKNETNLNVLGEAVTNLKTSLAYTPMTNRSEVNSLIANSLKEMMLNDAFGKSLQRTFFRYFLAFATDNHFEFIINTLNHMESSSMDLNQDDRWLMLQSLARNSYPTINKLIEAERSTDASNKGKVESNTALVQIPTNANKQVWFKNLTTPGQIDTDSTRSIISGYHDVLNPDISDFIKDQYFDMILQLLESKEDFNKVAILVSSLYPYNITNDFLIKTSQFIAQYSEQLPSKVQRALIKKYEDAQKMHTALNVTP